MENQECGQSIDDIKSAKRMRGRHVVKSGNVYMQSSGALMNIAETALVDANDWWPEHITESAWLEHTPFAAWLMPALQPKLLVELGTHRAVSYMAFCQANAKLPIPAKCFAVDTWQGDEHAGRYSESIFQEVQNLNRPYGNFSTLLRSSFEDALVKFEDRSIDLLHIDGFHTYEAVSNDFYSWLPKMSQRGIVLFHDTEVRSKDFGVWRLWSEVSKKYPHFHFKHGFGLGVLGVGTSQSPQMRSLCDLVSEEKKYDEVRSVFSSRGKQVTARYQEMSEASAERRWWTPFYQSLKTTWRAAAPASVREMAFKIRKKMD